MAARVLLSGCSSFKADSVPLFHPQRSNFSRQVVIRCSVNDDRQSDVVEQQAPPVPVKKQESFWDLFAFSGPVPEAVNGRLAMVGFTSALAMELSSGQDLVQQIESGGTSYFVGATLLFTLASLVPLFQGVTVEKASGGIGGVFTSQAERWNGRAAMLGLIALGLTEFVKGSPIV